ncbi:hypothetical protein N7466_003283, partial [Penicillium verhagenii]|uniref:uncharacterized protein n=1 Tax=Penicillium verhagenii TaxID=1562060 RepID=UPI0025455442
MPDQIFQPIDVAALEKYVCQNMPHIRGPIWVTQLGFDQSSPTYFVKDRVGNKLVMRKYPRTASGSKDTQRCEREYRVLCALDSIEIPVPQPHILCEDPRVLGTPFLVMESLDGRIFEDPTLPGVSPQERHLMWREIITALAKIHAVDIDAMDLSDLGPRDSFYSRQTQILKDTEHFQRSVVDTNTKNPVGKVPGIEEMLHFLSDRDYQPRDRACLIHGDFKISNIVFHETEPRIIGILNWKNATIGHPLSDIANLLQPWTIVQMSSSAADQLSLPLRSAASTVGLPSISECLGWYDSMVGWNPQKEMMWADAFALFRMSVARQGINACSAARKDNG